MADGRQTELKMIAPACISGDYCAVSNNAEPQGGSVRQLTLDVERDVTWSGLGIDYLQTF